MTTPITQAVHQAVPAALAGAGGLFPSGPCPLAPPGWACPLPAGHSEPCAAAPVSPPVAAPEPPPTPPQAPAAASRRSYGFKKAGEFDLDLPSGALVRCRKLSEGQLIELNLVEVLDGFTPELLADVHTGDEEVQREAFFKAVTDTSRNVKIFGPMDRVAAAVVIIPTVVLEGPTTDEQINVREVDLIDKLAIFAAAVGEQLNALKSIRAEQATGA